MNHSRPPNAYLLQERQCWFLGYTELWRPWALTQIEMADRDCLRHSLRTPSSASSARGRYADVSEGLSNGAGHGRDAKGGQLVGGAPGALEQLPHRAGAAWLSPVAGVPEHTVGAADGHPPPPAPPPPAEPHPGGPTAHTPGCPAALAARATTNLHACCRGT